MRHHIFTENNKYQIALLIKSTSFNTSEIQKYYADPLNKNGISFKDMIAFTLDYPGKKISVSEIKKYLNQLLPGLDSLGVTYLYVADANYFKVLTKQTKAEPNFGYILPCKIPSFEHMQVVLGVNHQQLFFNPDLQTKLNLSLNTLVSGLTNSYQEIGSGVIHTATYPKTHQEVAGALEKLHQYPTLSCDIEGFSLRFNESGIGTIAFAWDEHNGVAFACDYSSYPESKNEYYGCLIPDSVIQGLLKQFFETYQGEITWHNGAYDIKALVYNLWMKNPLDTKGMLFGIDLMTKKIQDTKIIAYLATNTTAGNVLGLKALAHEFAGNWAKEDIKDIRKIPLQELLQYNLIDALSTNYVKNKYYPVMVQDQQEKLYYDLMLPSMKLLLQIELTGMPQNKSKIQEVKHKLTQIQNNHLDAIACHPKVLELNNILTESAWVSDYESRKYKAKNPDKIKLKDKNTFPKVIYNPNSGPQTQRLLYEVLGLPILDWTETRQPATGAKTLDKLINHTQDENVIELLKALIGYGEVTIILSTFIPAFENGFVKADGMSWLHGWFNIGGTVSGRLSSNDPNLQNIPAGQTGSKTKQLLGKLIKECFEAPIGWLFCGADFNSLEDYISALTTKDPNKLAVYERGFDGHCLRAAYYFRNQLSHIDLNNVDSVNSISETHKHLRQKSKNPTFALTYQGTAHTLINTLGFEEEEAKMIEKNYHELYKVSDEYIQKRLEQASKDGYVSVAFGLRLRTPLLAQVVWNSSKVPFEATAEGRTAGNAMGQSYGLLNNRAAIEFMQKVWDSEYRYDILPVALIHDAIYILVKNDACIVEWANKELIKSMQWQELPEIQHDTVKLGAALDIYWPNWANAVTLPNNADRETIKNLCNDAKAKLYEKHT